MQKRKPGRPKRQPVSEPEPAQDIKDIEPLPSNETDGDPQELFEAYLEIEINRLKTDRKLYVDSHNAYMVQKIDRLILRYEAGERSSELMKLIQGVAFSWVN